MTEMKTDDVITEEDDMPVVESTVKYSLSTTGLPTALCKMQTTVLFAITDSDNPFYNSKYADLSSVWEVVRKPLTDNGMAIVQIPEADKDSVTVTTMLLHTSGDYIRSSITAYIPTDKSGKKTIQKMGSIITYLRRYALAALLGVCPVDDDAEIVMNREVPVPKKTPSKKRAKPTPPVEKDAAEVTGLPKGKRMIPLTFPDTLAEYEIYSAKINVKQLDAAGTYFDVNNTKVCTDRDTLYWCSMTGFSGTHSRIQADIVNAILRFGVDKVKELHPLLDLIPYGGE